MTLDEFWEHIQKSKRKDPDAHAELLEQRLAKLSAEDIVDFQYWWDVTTSEAYHWDLWAAAYYVHGGCSDDMFIDFRAWLVLQGLDVFHSVVNDPNKLLDYVDGDEEPELLCESYPASRAWDSAFGEDTDDTFNALYE